jgi:ubiquinone/menaquinone biosynthesis C-methylase UbiE
MVDERYLTDQGAEAYAQKYDRSIVRRFSARREAATLRLALEAVQASGTILDLPCGAGRFTGTIGRYADCVIAADISLPMVRVLTERFPRTTGVSAFLTDAGAVALRDRSVDGVVVMRLLHHLSDPMERRAVIRECARTADRFLIASFLDKRSLKQKFHAWKRALGGRPVRRKAVAREDIAADFEAAGFRVVKYFSLSFLFSGQTVAAAVRR